MFFLFFPKTILLETRFNVQPSSEMHCLHDLSIKCVELVHHPTFSNVRVYVLAHNAIPDK
jgi:hypothetical protein